MNKKGADVPSWLVAGLIVVALIVIVLLIWMGAFPELNDKIGSLATDVFKIKKEVFSEEAELEKAGKDIKSALDIIAQGINACYKSGEIGCSCPVDLSGLPKGYKVQFLSDGSDGIKLRALNPDEEFIKGVKTKAISGINLGMAEMGYNQREDVFGWFKDGTSKKKEFDDLICNFRKQFVMFGDEDGKVAFEAPEDMTIKISYEPYDEPLVSKGVQLLYKIDDKSFCFITSRVHSQYYKSGKLSNYFVFDENKHSYGIIDLYSGGRSVEPKNPKAAVISTSADYWMKFKPRCSNISYQEYIWPIEKDLTSLSCVSKGSLVSSTSKYPFYTGLELSAAKGQYVRSATDGVVKRVCDSACSPGQKYMVIKHLDKQTEYNVDVLYGNLDRIDSKFKSAGTKVKRGHAIAYVGDPDGRGARLDFSIKTEAGHIIDPVCKLPWLKNLYASSTGCDKHSALRLLACR
jgi:hypothetical protein